MDQTFCLGLTYTNVKIKAKHIQNIHSSDDYFWWRGDVTARGDIRNVSIWDHFNIFICEATRGQWNFFEIRPITAKDRHKYVSYVPP